MSVWKREKEMEKILKKQRERMKVVPPGKEFISKRLANVHHHKTQWFTPTFYEQCQTPEFVNFSLILSNPCTYIYINIYTIFIRIYIIFMNVYMYNFSQKSRGFVIFLPTKIFFIINCNFFFLVILKMGNEIMQKIFWILWNFCREKKFLTIRYF